MKLSEEFQDTQLQENFSYSKEISDDDERGITGLTGFSRFFSSKKYTKSKKKKKPRIMLTDKIHDTDAFKPGLYEVIKKNGINSTAGPLKQSGKENWYPCKSILKIIKIKYIPTEWRIRGQIKDSLDWVSIIETKTYTPWMKFIKPVMEEKTEKKIDKVTLDIEIDPVQSEKKSYRKCSHLLFALTIAILLILLGFSSYYIDWNPQEKIGKIQEIENLTQKYDTLKTEKDNLTTNHINLMTKMNGEIQNHKNTIQNHENDLNEKTKTIEDLNKSIEKKKIEISEKEKQIQKHESTIENLNLKLNNSESEVQRLREDSSTYKNSIDLQLKEKETEIARQDELIENLKE